MSKGNAAVEATAEEAGIEAILEMSSAHDSLMGPGKFPSIPDEEETICPQRSGPSKGIIRSMILQRTV